MPAIQPFSVGFDAYHLGIPREQNPWSHAGPAYLGCAGDFYDGWDTAEQREQDKADQKHDAQMGDDTQEFARASLGDMAND